MYSTAEACVCVYKIFEYVDIQAASSHDKTERSQCDFMVDKNKGMEETTVNVCLCGVSFC